MERWSSQGLNALSRFRTDVTVGLLPNSWEQQRDKGARNMIHDDYLLIRDGEARSVIVLNGEATGLY